MYLHLSTAAVLVSAIPSCAQCQQGQLPITTAGSPGLHRQVLAHLQLQTPSLCRCSMHRWSTHRCYVHRCSVHSFSAHRFSVHRCCIHKCSVEFCSVQRCSVLCTCEITRFYTMNTLLFMFCSRHLHNIPYGIGLCQIF